ncbi:hypothetical protein DW701_15915 [Bacteroides eggerthii]|jgi:hypothetical protein|uniref:Uncharacterized protein n=2 Tax=Bacteroides TaxID=816 RepID=A0A414M425_9BACE|nr:MULTISPECIES: hypothetical protein [Bacteroides]RGU00751.1 hypothetical protein DWX01_08500 [Bacteroides eggerthii]RHF03928.1 hypothetical protein DW701_15915 [Bacteroides eggerthii]RHH24404.1 hypothetical protein DW218_04200 [Bacteroides eggerthii]
MTKRMKLKLLRKWFAQSLAKPIRLSAQHFAELLETLFQESTTEADVTKLMIQAGFMERKRNKGTFYVVPTDELLGYAYRNKIDVSIFFEK